MKAMMLEMSSLYATMMLSLRKMRLTKREMAFRALEE
jgi:hypothetical protein